MQWNWKLAKEKGNIIANSYQKIVVDLNLLEIHILFDRRILYPDWIES
jgi:hypothetical protein